MMALLHLVNVVQPMDLQKRNLSVTEITRICQNRKARHDFDILETFEAGVALRGSEIKSVMLRHCSLDGAYAMISNNEAFLIGCNIEPYKQAGLFNHEPKRQRKLLLHKNEIAKIAAVVKAKGFTLVPLSVYLSRGKAKIELAVCKGRQLHDKRQALKEKEAKKEIKG